MGPVTGMNRIYVFQINQRVSKLINAGFCARAAVRHALLMLFTVGQPLFSDLYG